MAPGLLPLVFPVVAYDIADERYRRLAANILDAGIGLSDLRWVYLERWGVLKDGNLTGSLARMGLKLDEAA